MELYRQAQLICESNNNITLEMIALFLPVKLVGVLKNSQINLKVLLLWTGYLGDYTKTLDGWVLAFASKVRGCIGEFPNEIKGVIIMTGHPGGYTKMLDEWVGFMNILRRMSLIKENFNFTNYCSFSDINNSTSDSSKY
ncbi:hypothetical protein SNE40_005535 [Patella caerulea]|uniref:Uncharacterized protein n=1 Tax=Patella caerulea TaxID=87958 RepID=A0AAN8K845_PATCE